MVFLLKPVDGEREGHGTWIPRINRDNEIPAYQRPRSTLNHQSKMNVIPLRAARPEWQLLCRICPQGSMPMPNKSRYFRAKIDERTNNVCLRLYNIF